MFERVDVTGQMILDIRSEKSSTMNLNDFRTYILESSSGSEVLDQEMIAKGSLETQIIMQKKGEVCMRPGAANGTYTHRFSNVSYNGSLAEIMQGDPSQPERHWRYTCDAHKLHFEFDISPEFTFEWDLNKKL